LLINSKKHLPALDGLRGLAILLVFFYHYAGGLQHTAHATSMHVFGAIFGFGWSGVDLFFVLSGFLITGILFDTQDDPAYYKKFYVRRSLRIFPIYYIFLAVYGLFAFLRLDGHFHLGHLAFLFYLGYPATLLWPALESVSPSVHFTHLWSLCAEEQFYLIWPWVVSKLKTPFLIVGACLAAISVAPALRTFFVLHDLHAWEYAFLPSRMDALAVGALIAILMRGPGKSLTEKWATPMFLASSLFVAAICIVRRTVYHADGLISTAGFTFIAIAYGALLILAIRPGSLLERVFSMPLLRLFGKYSYGIYLFHFPLSEFLSPKREIFISLTHSFAIGSITFILACLIINLTIAAISFKFIESPIIGLKKRFEYNEDAKTDKQAQLITALPESEQAQQMAAGKYR
jgi:peptidoglycan/LPS O-acetylase OafA/YrhL